ncbi:hypothetical protein BJ878DRAFT_544701 [Calycina marina]|uniref:C3H1-type domain-containing protein n=1 Tax=Calycina marina TaxID=1763456 RepID=A0A9P7YY47_9HELO|nr:hypothetical protein BJ878DRAFT_544701 [Calycina marina]
MATLGKNAQRALEQAKNGLLILYGADYFTDEEWLKIDYLIHKGQYHFTNGPKLNQPLASPSDSQKVTHAAIKLAGTTQSARKRENKVVEQTEPTTSSNIDIGCSGSETPSVTSANSAEAVSDSPSPTTTPGSEDNARKQLLPTNYTKEQLAESRAFQSDVKNKVYHWSDGRQSPSWCTTSAEEAPSGTAPLPDTSANPSWASEVDAAEQHGSVPDQVIPLAYTIQTPLHSSTPALTKPQLTKEVFHNEYVKNNGKPQRVESDYWQPNNPKSTGYGQPVSSRSSTSTRSTKSIASHVRAVGLKPNRTPTLTPTRTPTRAITQSSPASSSARRIPDLGAQYIASEAQKPTSKLMLEARAGDLLRVLTLVSGDTYWCRNERTKLKGQFRAKKLSIQSKTHQFMSPFQTTQTTQTTQSTPAPTGDRQAAIATAVPSPPENFAEDLLINKPQLINRTAFDDVTVVSEERVGLTAESSELTTSEESRHIRSNWDSPVESSVGSAANASVDKSGDERHAASLETEVPVFEPPSVEDAYNTPPTFSPTAHEIKQPQTTDSKNAAQMTPDVTQLGSESISTVNSSVPSFIPETFQGVGPCVTKSICHDVSTIDNIESTNVAAWEQDSDDEPNSSPKTRVATPLSEPAKVGAWQPVTRNSSDSLVSQPAEDEVWEPVVAKRGRRAIELPPIHPFNTRPVTQETMSLGHLSRFSVLPEEDTDVKIDHAVQAAINMRVQKVLSSEMNKIRKSLAPSSRLIGGARPSKSRKDPPASPVVLKTHTCWWWATGKVCRFTEEECRHLHSYIGVNGETKVHTHNGKPTWGAAADYVNPTPPLVESGKEGGNYKSLTCYYWATKGKCSNSDEDCSFSHAQMTGGIANPPRGHMKRSQPLSMTNPWRGTSASSRVDTTSQDSSWGSRPAAKKVQSVGGSDEVEEDWGKGQPAHVNILQTQQQQGYVGW